MEELCCRSALWNVGMCWLCRTGRRESMIDGKPEVPVLAVSWDCFAPSCMASTPCQWLKQHGEQSHICNRRTSVALTVGIGVGRLGLKIERLALPSIRKLIPGCPSPHFLCFQHSPPPLHRPLLVTLSIYYVHGIAVLGRVSAWVCVELVTYLRCA